MSDIFELSDQAVDRICELRPTTATAVGVAGYDDRWDDLSPAGRAAERELFADLLGQAHAASATDPRERIAQRVLIAECEREVSALDSGEWRVDLNNIASPWQDIATIYSLMGRQAEDWRAIVARLLTTGEALSGYRQALEAGLDAGVVAAKRQVETAIEQGRHLTGDESSLLNIVADFDSAAEAVRAELGADFRTQVADAVAHAMAKFAAMTDWFERVYLAAAPIGDGVGAERYVQSARNFLGESIDPTEIYNWGWSEISRLRGENNAICQQIDPDRSPAEVIELLDTDPARAAHGVDQFIEMMQARQEQAMALLVDEHFDLDERVRVIEVLPAPAGGATAPYYTGPSEDFSRPGRVWYPVDDRTTFPLYGEVTTAYHEGFPGHHLQVGWQSAMGDQVSRFHRNMVWYPGSGEGWALYAEHLMNELGFFEKPEYVLGLLTSQMFRSCRIVIDIGLHLGLAIPEDSHFHPGETWTYDLAIEMLESVAFLSPTSAKSEVIRYLGWPGQAISYKLGEKAILDLRSELEGEPGFDRKQFHADVLSVGSVGLDLLRDLVRGN